MDKPRKSSGGLVRERDRTLLSRRQENLDLEENSEKWRKSPQDIGVCITWSMHNFLQF